MEHRVSFFLVVCLGLAHLANAQLACPSFTLADLGSDTSFSTDGLLATALGLGGEGGIDVEAQVVNYRILCDASGSMRGTSSYVSVLVQFMCNAASINVCDGTTMVTRQFQFSCGAGEMWIASIFGSSNNIQTLNPTATFTTTPSNQCRACVDDEQVTSPNINNATHCFACSSACNQGQMRCYIGTPDDICCNFYLENQCVTECPFNLTANDNFDCECTSLSLDNGDVTFTNGMAINSVATHTCEPGYRLLPEGGQVRTCSASGWSGQDVTCEKIVCPTNLMISFGNVEISPVDGSLNATATYSCSETDYSLKGGDRIRHCQIDSTWNGTAPACEQNCGGCGPGTCNVSMGKCDCPPNYAGEHCSKKCSATEIDPDCIECAFDASGTPICAMCKGGVEPGEDGKCPTTTTDTSTGGNCSTACIVGIVFAILGAVIMAVVVTLVVYAVYSYLSSPATKLAKAGTEGLNGVARDNPLYLPPEDVVGDVETA